MLKKDAHIVVGLSGGVDSAVSALLLSKENIRLTAVFMKNWEEDDTENYCNAAVDIKDASAICKLLNIPFHTTNFSNEYWDFVFTQFLEEHNKGRTPNPDIWCNKEIKFNAFLKYALSLDADYIATGHYAQNIYDPQTKQHYLCKAKDNSKDQTYFLYTLTQEQLARAIFPLGELEKTAVRKIANENNFSNHDKKDSTGICFIGERKFKDFLGKYCKEQPGAIVSVEGKILGQHDGLMFYTIGQRQGIGIGGRRDADENPWYVVDKDIDQNQLIVAQGVNHPRLFKQSLYCEQVNWINQQSDAPINCNAKIRYRQNDQECQVTKVDDNRYRVDFSIPQRAVTPGQSIVFYQDHICLGGGIIV